MALSGVDVMAFFDKNQDGKSSKVNGRIWPDASGKYGGVISWDNGQTWVRETTSTHLTAYQSKDPVVVNMTALNPTTRLGEERRLQSADHSCFDKKAANYDSDDGSERGHCEDGSERGLSRGQSSEASSAEIENEIFDSNQRQKYAHAAVTHNPAVLWYLNQNKFIIWSRIDISDSMFSSKTFQEIHIPRWAVYFFLIIPLTCYLCALLQYCMST